MRVHVERVRIPPYSTLGYGEGTTVGPERFGAYVQFAGDHRPMRLIGEAIAAEEYVEVEVPDYAITRISPCPMQHHPFVANPDEPTVCIYDAASAEHHHAPCGEEDE